MNDFVLGKSSPEITFSLKDLKLCDIKLLYAHV